MENQQVDSERERTIQYIFGLAERNFSRVGTQVIADYFTNLESRERWNSLSFPERLAVLDEHLSNLDGRSTGDLAEKYLQGVPQKLARSVISSILYIGIQKGILTEEERRTETLYRQSVCNALNQRDNEIGKKGGSETKRRGHGIFALTSEERSVIAKRLYEEGVGVGGASHEELAEYGRRGGTKLHELGKGVFAMKREDKQEIGRKVGTQLLREGRGIHAQTLEERVELGKKSAEARGQVPYSEDEINAIRELAEDRNYQHDSGPHTGKPNWSEISVELRNRFGVERKASSLRNAHYKLNKGS